MKCHDSSWALLSSPSPVIPAGRGRAGGGVMKCHDSSCSAALLFLNRPFYLSCFLHSGLSVRNAPAAQKPLKTAKNRRPGAGPGSGSRAQKLEIKEYILLLAHAMPDFLRRRAEVDPAGTKTLIKSRTDHRMFI